MGMPAIPSPVEVTLTVVRPIMMAWGEARTSGERWRIGIGARGIGPAGNDLAHRTRLDPTSQMTSIPLP